MPESHPATDPDFMSDVVNDLRDHKDEWRHPGRVEELSRELADWHEAGEETEVALLHRARKAEQRADEAEAALAELKAENEALRREAKRLEVCVLCEHCYIDQDAVADCDEMHDGATNIGMFDHCYFTPSRWTERGEA